MSKIKNALTKTVVAQVTITGPYYDGGELQDERGNLESVILDGLGHPDGVTVKVTNIAVTVDINTE